MIKFVLLLLILYCPISRAREDSEFWRDILRPYSEKFGELMANNDFEATMDLYDDDFILMRPFTSPLKGKRAMKEEFKKMQQKRFKYRSVSGESIEVWGCGDQIFERGTLAFSYTTKAITKPQAYYGSFMTIWQKQKDGTFRIKCSIWNLDFNPWE